jgi:CDP-paratose 2-epimerase
VACFISEFLKKPRIAEVYNIGGGRNNSTSILEAFERISKISGKEMKYSYDEQNRSGDHICYISDLSKMIEHYPNWNITKDLQTTFEEIHQAWKNRI